MSRQRILSPEFFTDEKICSLPPLDRLLFQGMWGIADREGRLAEKPFELKIKVMPADDVDITTSIDRIEERGLVIRYEVDGQKYLLIRNFLKFQKPHFREAASTLPSPEKAVPRHNLGCAQPEASPEKVVPGRAVSVSETVPVSVPVSKPLSTKVDPRVTQVFDHWVSVMGMTRTVMSPKRQKAIEGRLADGYDVAALKAAVDGCARTPHNMGQNDRGTKFNDIELICRSPENVDRFMSAKGAQRPKGYDPDQGIIQHTVTGPPPDSVELFDEVPS